jgi:hypothetical protein
LAVERAPEDVRAEHMHLMGDDLGAVYHELWNQVSWLHVKWQRFIALFGGAKGTVDLMNATALAFFAEIQRALLMDLLLHISCLTDPPKTGQGKKAQPNLTLRQLPDLLPDEIVRGAIHKKLQELGDRGQFARDWRNRHIAHRDLALATQPTQCRPLDSPTREKIEKALAGIRDVMNTVLSRFKESRTLYEYGLGSPGDAEDLIYYLREGFEAHRRRLAELHASVRPPSPQG